MRWTTGIGLAAGALALSSCAVGYRTVIAARYDAESRPEGSYYCYDCHGYRYFDPYYDYCPYYGFRYRWDEHPGAGVLYRERYVGIRRLHPEYGRYRYHEDYRASSRYREPQSYELWRRGAPAEDGTANPGLERRPAHGRRGGWKGHKGQDDGAKDRRKHEKERDRGGQEPSDSRQGA